MDHDPAAALPFCPGSATTPDAPSGSLPAPEVDHPEGAAEVVHHAVILEMTGPSVRAEEADEARRKTPTTTTTRARTSRTTTTPAHEATGLPETTTTTTTTAADHQAAAPSTHATNTTEVRTKSAT